MTAPAAPPPGERPLDVLPPDAPATVEDVRASRRWTWVALAWAIAASAIAVIALLGSSDDSSNQTAQPSSDPTPRIERFEKQTNDRLDAFSRKLNGAASESDVQKLEKRLATAEDDAAEAKDAAAKSDEAISRLQQQIDDLEQRVDELEQNQQSQPPAEQP